MSYLVSSKGYLAVSDQASKGTPIAYDAVKLYLKYLEESFATEIDMMNLREGGDDELMSTSVKNLHKEKFGFKVYARPQVLAYMISWFLGADTKSGAGDPYTHVLTRASAGRKYLTFYRKLDTNKIQQMYDAKIESIMIEGEAGKPITLSIEGNGCNVAFTSSAGTESYETDDMFVFYDGNGRFTIDGSTTTDIKKFSIKMTIKSQEGLQTDDIGIEDLPDLQLDIEFAADLYAQDTTLFKKITYYNTSAPSQNLYEGEATIDLRYTKSTTDDRTCKIEIPKITFKPITGLNLKSEPAVMVQTIAGIARKISGSEIITFTLKNDLSADLA